MAHSGKTITFATDLLPNEDKVYNLGTNNQRWKIYGELQPLETKTYENVIATLNTSNAVDQATGGFFYAKIYPTAFNVIWHTKFKVTVYVPGQNNYHAVSIYEVWGMADTYMSYKCQNAIRNTNYRPVYYNSLFRAKETGYNNNLGHWAGFSLRNSANPNNTSYKRTVQVQLLEYDNCTVEMQNSLITPTNIPSRNTTNYVSTNTSYDDFDFYNNGLRETGDDTANDTDRTIQELYYFRYRTGAAGVGRYTLLMEESTGVYSSITTTFATKNDPTTRTNISMNTGVKYRLDRILYFNQNVDRAANTNIGNNAQYFTQYDLIDLRYTFKLTAGSLTAYQPFYMVGTLDDQGLFTIADADNAWTQTLPSSADGKVYIFLGMVYPDSSTYRIEFELQHPIYGFINGKLREIQPGDATSATNISSELPTLAVATENNEIKVIDLGNGNPVSIPSQRHAIDFRWYDSHWAIGNLRSSSTPSAGFGFSYSSDGGSAYTNQVIISNDGNISANGTIKASALEIGASGKYVNFTSTGIKLGDATATANGPNLITVNGHMVINGSYNSSNSWSEGIRINRSSNGQANIILGGRQGTTANTETGVWTIGSKSTPADATSTATGSTLFISYNGGDTATCRITGHGSDGWSIRPRLGIGLDVDTNYGLKVAGSSWLQGPLRIGNADTAGTGTDQNGYAVANSGSTNYIAFYGVYRDGAGGFNHTYIGESIYGSKTTANEQSELLLFHGNDPGTPSGPDRIRLFAGQIDIQVYTSTTDGSWDTIRATSGTQVANFTNGQVTITGNLLPEATNSRTLGSSANRWKELYLESQAQEASNGIMFYSGSNLYGRISSNNSTGGVGVYGSTHLWLRPSLTDTSTGIELTSANLYPTTSTTVNLGASDHKWADLYTTNTISSSIGGDGWIQYPEGGTYVNSNASVKGALKITLPSINKQTMMSFDVHIYTYNGDGASSVVYHIHGYNYNSAGWHNNECRAYSEGIGAFANLTVRFGKDSDTTTCVVIGDVGENGTEWSYPQVAISNVHLGFKKADFATWGTGWSISFITTLPSSINGTHTNVNTQNINVNGNAATATKFASSVTLWGQTFDGSSNITGNISNIGTLSSSSDNFQFFKSNGSTAANGQFGKLSLYSTYSDADLSTYFLDVGGISRFRANMLLNPSKDATMIVYAATNTTYGNETIAIQTCFDNKNPIDTNHTYTTTYEDRCNLLLQPKGGQVYIGTDLTTLGNTNYSLYVTGKVYTTDQLQVASSTASTSTTVGAIVTNGGIATGAASYLTGTVHIVGTASNNALMVRGISGSGSDGNRDTTAANQELYLNYNGGKVQVGFAETTAVSTNMLKIAYNSDSSSTSTGALVVDGGVGIAKKLYVGAKTTTDTLTITNTTQTSHLTLSTNGYNFITMPNNAAAKVAIAVNTNLGTEANSKLVICQTGVVRPGSTNTQTLGDSSYRWQKVYVGTANTYGNAYTPVYWNEGVPAPVSVVRMIGWTFDSGSTGTTLSSNSFTTNTIVIQIVVHTNESNLTGPINWQSNDRAIILSTTATSGIVGGYIIVAEGLVDSSITSNSITPTSNTVQYPLANGVEF